MNKPSKASKSKILSLLLGGCIGLIGSAFILRLSGHNALLYCLYLLLYLAGLILALPVQIILHEGGHLVFGLLTGYRFVSFNVMGLLCRRGADGKLHIGRLHIAGAAGQCLMAPPAYSEGRFPCVLYTLGGVMMNLIVSALCILLILVTPFPWLKLLLLGQAMVGLFSAVTNGLPLRITALQNDGQNLLSLRREPQARRAFWLQMSVAAAMTEGVRLRNMPEEWFAPFPEEVWENPLVTAVAVMATSRWMDQQDFPAAESAIRALLNRERGVLDIHRALITCDGAVCELIAGRPANLTASLDALDIQQIMQLMHHNPSMLRTRYAVALLRDQNAAEAEALLAAFELAAPHHPYAQEIDSERELISAIQEAARRTPSGGSHAP